MVHVAGRRLSPPLCVTVLWQMMIGGTPPKWCCCASRLEPCLAGCAHHRRFLSHAGGLCFLKVCVRAWCKILPRPCTPVPADRVVLGPSRCCTLQREGRDPVCTPRILSASSVHAIKQLPRCVGALGDGGHPLLGLWRREQLQRAACAASLMGRNAAFPDGSPSAHTVQLARNAVVSVALCDCLVSLRSQTKSTIVDTRRCRVKVLVGACGFFVPR